MNAAAKWTVRLLVVLALIAPFFLIFELLGRGALYYWYGSQPYLNHVGDEYFDYYPERAQFSLYSAGIAAVIAGIFRRPVLFIISMAAISGSFAAPKAITYLHTSHKLVTYSEFSKAIFGEPASEKNR